ncbi:MAG: GerMN domain-containing protein [Acidobacteriaceae bacterium]
MIPRYQRILFWSLVAGIVLMLLFLLRGCDQAHQKLNASADLTPIAAPTAQDSEEVTFLLASDADGSIAPASRQLSLPGSPTVRARMVLQRLLAEYSLPASAHPLTGGPTVEDVFFLSPPVGSLSEFSRAGAPPDQLAIVNLNSAFLNHHPSGIQVEDLTLQSIIGTLHAALPEITEVRFLVDGQPHDTLAGHAALLRSYPAIDTTFKPFPPTVPQAPTKP